MHRVEFARDDDAPLLFYGEQIARVSTQRSGVDRWTVFRIYRTRGGNYVLRKTGATRVPDERERNTAVVVDRIDKRVAEFFGTSSLAADLYAQVEFDWVTEVVE